MTGIVRKPVFRTSLLFFFMGLGLVSTFPKEASVSVVVKNETGYNLEEVKYVLETGDTKTLVEQAQDVADGGSCTFRLVEEGAYRIYASLTIGGKKVYAKGNAHNLRNGASYRLTLQRVVFSQQGAGLNFIDKSEFDSIK
jgi:hypothetical protein